MPVQRLGSSVEAAAQQRRARPPTPRSRRRSASGTAPAFSYSTPLCTSSVASPPSSRIMFGPPPSGQRSTCSVHHQYSSSVSPFQAKTGHALRVVDGAVGADRDGRGGVVLGGEDVAASPAHLGAEGGERLDEHRGLDGHVQRAGDAGAGERLGVGVLGPQRHEAGHLVLGELDLLAAEGGEGEVGDLEVAWSVRAWRCVPPSVRTVHRRGTEGWDQQARPSGQPEAAMVSPRSAASAVGLGAARP